MKRLGVLTLQKRIVLLVVAALALGLGLFSLLGIQSLNESTQRILTERLSLARHLAGHLDETLTYIQKQLQDVNFNNSIPTQDEFVPAADSLLKEFSHANIAARNVILIDGQGKAIQVQPPDPELIGADMSAYSEIKQSLETGVTTVSALVYSPLIDVPVVFATSPIKDANGQVIGAIAGSIVVAESTNNAFSPAITVEETGYIEIVDGNGIVIARTKPGSPPQWFEVSDHPGRFAELINRHQATVGTCHRCHGSDDEPRKGRDVLAFAPLSTVSWGVAIRQSEEEALAPTRQLERRLFLLGAIVIVITFILAWAMMQGIVRPVKMLILATKRVAAGNFKAVIPAKRQDEIGQLSTAFYNMTQELDRSRGELVLRNEELSALNSIANTVSQSLNLGEVVEHALRRVMEVTKTTSGCVFLRDSGSNELEVASRVGLSNIFDCSHHSGTEKCACHQVLQTGQALMVNDVSQCPALGTDTVVAAGIGCFVSIPLKSKNRILGIMNMACSNEQLFTENDFRILDSIGYQVGLAIENSELFEEAKQKEKLRGELLNSVINAQEEERKRVARELHDEFGQTLAGLIINIDSLKATVPSYLAELSHKLEKSKSLVARSLAEMRRLTSDLRPSVLDDLGLVAAIQTYTESRLDGLGVKTKFESSGMNRRLSPAVESALFRIVQEAVHNITKHAQARNARIRLEASNAKITVLVEDDGKGFDVPAILKSKNGAQSLGLLGIQERASLLGGTLKIESHVGQGTRLIVEIPATYPPDECGPSGASRKAEWQTEGRKSL